MADKFCDHGLYPTYAATPTWATAQDGDGLAATIAVSSVGSVVFSQGHSAGTVAVFGATVTPATSASADVAANNLATAINASTTAVSTAFASYAPQLRNLVFARGPSTGAPAGTCQIMTRAGSAGFNDVSSTTLVQASFNGTAPTLNQFAGGSSGAWGYFLSTAIMWPSVYAAGAYGLLNNATLAGYLSDGDVVYVRAGNKTINVPNVVATSRDVGVGGVPITFVIEDGSVVSAWAADYPNPVLTLAQASSNSANCTLSLLRNQIIGKTNPNGTKSLVFQTTTSAGGLSVSVAAACRLVGFEVTHLGAAKPAFIGTAGFPSTGLQTAKFEDFRIHSHGGAVAVGGSTGQQSRMEFKTGVFHGGGSVSPATALITNANARTAFIKMHGVEFQDYIAGSVLTSNVTGRMFFEDCDFGNVSVRGPFCGSLAVADDYSKYVAAHANYGGRDFWLDTTTGMTEWNSINGFPTLSAVLPDGVTPWSWRVQPSTVAYAATGSSPHISPQITKVNSLADGARTFKTHFCVADSLSWDRSSVSVAILYEAVDGSLVTLSSHDEHGGALTTDAATTWSNEAAGKVAWYTPTLLSHNKYRIELTTQAGKNLKSGSLVKVWFKVHTTVAASTECVFVDPDVEIV